MRRSLGSRRGILALAAVATAVKLAVALRTFGTNDVAGFHEFGSFIADRGLGAMYRADPSFNHVPLTGLFAAAISGFEDFPAWLRLPGILADVGMVLALLRIRERTGSPPWWALALFALSPVSLLVSGFHGNVDPVMTMAMLWAAVMVTEDRPVACAAWFGLAVNVKVAALLLAPLLLLVWWHRRRLPPFAAVWVALVGAGWLPGMLAAPREFVDQVLGYGGLWGSWGIPLLAARLGVESMEPVPAAHALTSAQQTCDLVLNVATVGLAVAIAWLGRRSTGIEVFGVAALTWAVFFVLAPGIGPQYLVWVMPFLVVAHPRCFALVTVTGSAAVVAFYGVTSQWRFQAAFSTHALRERWELWMLLPWLSFVVTALVLGRVVWITSRSRHDPEGLGRAEPRPAPR